MVDHTAERRDVLLIDDDGVFCALVARHLGAHGHAVVRAGSAGEARALVRAGLRPGLVILDINLPDETGWALLRDGTVAAAGSPQVVVATGTAINPRKLRELGIAGYLPKPFSMDLLTACVARLTGADGPREAPATLDVELDELA